MKIGLVAPVKPSHPYLENDPGPLFDLHYLRISPWLWFRITRRRTAARRCVITCGPSSITTSVYLVG